MSLHELLYIHTRALESWSSSSVSRSAAAATPCDQDDVPSSAASGHSMLPAWCTAMELQFPGSSTSGWGKKLWLGSSTDLTLFAQQCASDTIPFFATVLPPHFQNVLVVCFSGEQIISDQLLLYKTMNPLPFALSENETWTCWFKILLVIMEIIKERTV